ESVWFPEPDPILTSLIFNGLAFRNFSTAVSVCPFPFALFQEAFAVRSPSNAREPDVNLNVALTVAPGATGSSNVFEALPPSNAAFQPLGAAILNLTPCTAEPLLFVNATSTSCDEPTAKVCTPGAF